MRLATARVPGGTRAVRITDAGLVDLGVPDVGALLSDPDWRTAAAADGPLLASADLEPAPVVPRPSKILCVGLNYRNHILEMGRELPQFPTLFAKFAPSLVGAYDDVVLPTASQAIDWEAELALVIGAPVRHADAASARTAIAGYTICNDVTARDWQYRTAQWLQGKTFADTTPVGPWLDTEIGADTDPDLDLSCLVDGEQVQSARTGDLVFGPADLVSYISTIVPLEPGDLVITGTPGGVGHARKPARYLTDGAVLTTRIEGLGECVNTCRAEKAQA
ncbi:fumarylacetoacetate hydrolase family protein [Pseudonocardia dioxanivorans]|jgi:acylpyruvate hydrolase|uniref:fumarylacetoacetate hydrolase family protein n=1 Tax=Pseudonocardia dioxanivorans TaxID=240495 RepID=UPI000CD2A530|nr:fumarylacetoacetate hydrolase family protein [Pseudonocardia dioxanivorans]